MPVTKSRNGMHEMFDTNPTTSFLFGKEDDSATSPKHYMSATEDNFPTLVRQEQYPGKVSILFSNLFLPFSTDLTARCSFPLRLQLSIWHCHNPLAQKRKATAGLRFPRVTARHNLRLTCLSLHSQTEQDRDLLSPMGPSRQSASAPTPPDTLWT